MNKFELENQPTLTAELKNRIVRLEAEVSRLSRIIDEALECPADEPEAQEAR